MQLALPPADLYVPGAQGEHAEPSGPVKPGWHLQSVDHDDSAGEEVLAGHEFSTPVQHHVLMAHAWQTALSIPS